MDIVYASLHRMSADAAADDEVPEVLDILWAHTVAADGLEHVSGRVEADRVDLLLFLAPQAPTAPLSAGDRAAALLARCHRASPLMRHRYLPPRP
ncbi:MAG: hypothetical protein HOY69_12145 [Streptomyces sp.]|nr:hypothetical protein [Streptomyces sp.]